MAVSVLSFQASDESSPRKRLRLSMILNPFDPLDAFLMNPSFIPPKDDSGKYHGIFNKAEQPPIDTFCTSLHVRKDIGTQLPLAEIDNFFGEQEDPEEDRILYRHCLQEVDTETISDLLWHLMKTYGPMRDGKRQYLYIGGTNDPTWRALTSPYAHFRAGTVYNRMIVLMKGDVTFIRRWEVKTIKLVRETFAFDAAIQNIGNGGEGLSLESKNAYYLYAML